MKLYSTVGYILVVVHFVICKEKIVESYQECSRDTDCQINSFCYGNDNARKGLCKCDDGFVINRNRSAYECLSVSCVLGSDCTRDVQCEINLGIHSQCGVKNTCECLPTAHYDLNQRECYRTARFNETCREVFECVSDVDAILYCTSGYCTCGVGERGTTDGRCVKSHHLGEACESDESCIHMDAVCRDVCRCKINYVVANDAHNCLPAAFKLQENCTQLSQCTNFMANSECISGSCVCSPGHHGYGNECALSRQVDEACSDKKECVRNVGLIGAVDCVKGVCTCTAGTDSTGRDCAPNNKAHIISGGVNMLWFGVVIVIFLII